MSDKKIPTSYDELHPGRFLKAGLLQGKHVTLTIAKLYLDDLEGDDGTQRCGVLAFEGKKLELVLNKINSKCLAALFGKKPADAIGHKVTIYPDTCLSFGEVVDCIRIAGSPELRGDKIIKVKQGRKTVKWTLKKTGGAPEKPLPGGGAEVDSETGEVSTAEEDYVNAGPPDREPGEEG